MSATFTIGQLAQAASVSRETIRYYQRIGLLDTPQTAGAIRHYDVGFLHRLRFIRRAKEAGFLLEEIRDLLQFDAITDREHIRVLARRKSDSLKQRVAELSFLAQRLDQLIERCEQDPPEEACPILNTFQ